MPGTQLKSPDRRNPAGHLIRYASSAHRPRPVDARHQVRLLSHWDKVVGVQRVLAGDDGLATPVRMVLDIQKSCGQHHYRGDLRLINCSGSLELLFAPERWADLMFFGAGCEERNDVETKVKKNVGYQVAAAARPGGAPP